jgi:hypothetical protein
VRLGVTATLVGLGVLGCATTAPPPAPPPELTLRLPPAALGSELSLAQRLTVVRGTERRGFDALLEADASAVRIAALALGQRVASLSWDGAHFEAQVSSQVPDFVTAPRILTDVQLAWWPAAAVEAGLPAGYALEASGTRRVLRRGGATVVLVTYEGVAPAWRRVTLQHLERGYTLEIDSVEQAP